MPDMEGNIVLSLYPRDCLKNDAEEFLFRFAKQVSDAIISQNFNRESSCESSVDFLSNGVNYPNRTFPA